MAFGLVPFRGASWKGAVGAVLVAVAGVYDALEMSQSKGEDAIGDVVSVAPA